MYLAQKISLEQLINWADDQISIGDDRELIFELSLSASKPNSTILEILYNSINDSDQIEFCGTFKLFLKEINNVYDWSDQQEKLMIVYHKFKELLDSDNVFWSRLVDDYQLRKDGFTGCMDMPNELNQFINSHIQN